MSSQFFDPKDIGPDDIIVVICPKDPGDPCYFDLPGEEQGVWVARVTGVIHSNDMSLLDGIFMWNAERDLTKPLIPRPTVEFIEFEKDALVGVFVFEPNFRFTHANVKTLQKYARSFG